MGSIAEILVNNIGVKGPKGEYEKRSWKSCLVFVSLSLNTSRTSIMYLVMWRQLEPPFLDTNLTGAGTG